MPVETNRTLIVIIYYCSLLLGCKINTYPDNHPAHFKRYFDNVDSSRDQDKHVAVAEMNAAFRAFHNPGIDDLFQKFEREKDFYYYVGKNYIESMLYADSMLQITNRWQNIETVAIMRTKALFYKGDCYYKLKRYSDAFSYYSSAKQYALDHIRNKCSLTEFDSYNGYLFYTQGKYEVAIKYFYNDVVEQLKCPFDVFDRIGNIQRNLDNLGICYYRLGRYDSAAYYYNSALQFINKNKRKFAEREHYTVTAKAVINGNIANMLADKGKYSDAESLYKQSAEITRPIDPSFACSIEIYLARMYLKIGKVTETNLLITKIKAALDSVPYESALLRWYQLKTEYLEKTNQQILAFANLKVYNHIKDSVDARDKNFAAMDINREFETLEQKTLNQQLQNENQQKQVYLIITAVISVMAMVIVVMVLNNLKRSKNHVSELNKKNDDLNIAFSSLELSHKENKKIMRIVAHDLKNPISAVRNLIYALLKKDQPPEQREILEIIQESCVNSVILINDLLTDKVGIDKVRKELVNIAGLLQSCVELHQAKANEKNQTLHLEADKAEIVLNVQKIWRVISNMINNAIKFSPVNSDIEIKLKKLPDTVLLSVTDKGMGIPDALKSKIFNSPEEAMRIGTVGEESYGLGLFISKGIVEEHGGRIWFESVEGSGSAFYVEFPLITMILPV